MLIPLHLSNTKEVMYVREKRKEAAWEDGSTWDRKKKKEEIQNEKWKTEPNRNELNT